MLLETRGAVAIIWLNRPPANPLSPQLITEFGELWKHCNASDEIRSVVIASSNIFTFSAGADIKEFTKMDASARRGAARLAATRCCARWRPRARRRSRP